MRKVIRSRSRSRLRVKGGSRAQFGGSYGNYRGGMDGIVPGFANNVGQGMGQVNAAFLATPTFGAPSAAGVNLGAFSNNLNIPLPPSDNGLGPSNSTLGPSNKGNVAYTRPVYAANNQRQYTGLNTPSPVVASANSTMALQNTPLFGAITELTQKLNARTATLEDILQPKRLNDTLVALSGSGHSQSLNRFLRENLADAELHLDVDPLAQWLKGTESDITPGSITSLSIIHDNATAMSLFDPRLIGTKAVAFWTLELVKSAYINGQGKENFSQALRTRAVPLLERSNVIYERLSRPAPEEEWAKWDGAKNQQPTIEPPKGSYYDYFKGDSQWGKWVYANGWTQWAIKEFGLLIFVVSLSPAIVRYLAHEYNWSQHDIVRVVLVPGKFVYRVLTRKGAVEIAATNLDEILNTAAGFEALGTNGNLTIGDIVELNQSLPTFRQLMQSAGVEPGSDFEENSVKTLSSATKENEVAEAKAKGTDLFAVLRKARTMAEDQIGKLLASLSETEFELGFSDSLVSNEATAKAKKARSGQDAARQLTLLYTSNKDLKPDEHHKLKAALNSLATYTSRNRTGSSSQNSQPQPFSTSTSTTPSPQQESALAAQQVQTNPLLTYYAWAMQNRARSRSQSRRRSASRRRSSQPRRRRSSRKRSARKRSSRSRRRSRNRKRSSSGSPKRKRSGRKRSTKSRSIHRRRQSGSTSPKRRR